MKNLSFVYRALFAIDGIKSAYRTESSFRTQIKIFFISLFIMILLRPKWHWFGLYFLTCAGVLASELFNTALESLCDKIQPEDDPKIKIAKDCAAGAVTIFSIASIIIFIMMIFDMY